MSWKRFMQVEQIGGEDQDELFRTLYRHMFIVAYAKMKNRADALDVVQESWIKILRKLDSLTDPNKLVQWAKVIVANTAINTLKRKTFSVVPLYDDHMYIGDLGSDLYVEDNLLKHAIYESLGLLDDDTRKMMIGKFYYDWKDRQIAEMIGMPVGTVKARIHRAKKQLRAHLEAEYGKEPRVHKTSRIN